jgi:hypothetical protein
LQNIETTVQPVGRRASPVVSTSHGRKRKTPTWEHAQNRTRTEGPSGARKTTMIVALARKLLIALWRPLSEVENSIHEREGDHGGGSLKREGPARLSDGRCFWLRYNMFAGGAQLWSPWHDLLGSFDHLCRNRSFVCGDSGMEHPAGSIRAELILSTALALIVAGFSTFLVLS